MHCELLGAIHSPLFSCLLSGFSWSLETPLAAHRSRCARLQSPSLDFVEGTWPDLTRLGEVNFLGTIGVPSALVLWIATFGIGEEIGWRGFALPRLQQRHGALKATLLLAMVWAVLSRLWFFPTARR